MNDQTKKYLFDILSAIREIEEYTDDITDITAYHQNKLAKRAVERMLGIVGEATNKLTKEDAQSLSDAREIVGFRNRIIHAYDFVDDEIVWKIIQDRLPDMKQEIEEILQKNG